MALNLKTFQTRTLTAIVFAAIMLTGLFWNHWSFFILFSIIHFGCWWEYFNLGEKIYPASNGTSIHRYTRLGFMLTGFAIMLLFCGPAFEINNYRLNENFAFPVSVAGFVMLGMGIFQTAKINLKLFGFLLFGLLYISLCWGLMMDLRQYGIVFKGNLSMLDFGIIIPAGIIFSIWINDTMAYIVGSMFGKTPLSKISPKKTWEGTIGGAILAIVFMSLVAYFLVETSLINSAMVAAIASVFGTLGDLFESKLKRMAGVKDSGSLMPGHGGFLDRFDSLLIAVPAVWLYIFLKAM
jgi:phosphatidate cytidylyltransferase